MEHLSLEGGGPPSSNNVTVGEGGGDGVNAESLGAVADGRVLKAEAGRAALRVMGVQVEESQLTPKAKIRRGGVTTKKSG